MSEQNKKELEKRCKELTPHFKATEFKCECNGKYCDGYPVIIDEQLLRNLETLRKHYGNKPINITSGMRCQKFNDSLRGSISSSRHTKGLAVDFNIKPNTYTESGRNEVMKFVKTLPQHNYTYGNTRGMGVAIHMDIDASKKPLPKPVTRNTKVDQIEVKSKTINCRVSAGLDSEVVGLMPAGFYNFVKMVSKDNFKWLYVADDRCCALIEEDVELLQREPEKDYEKLYEAEKEKNTQYEIKIEIVNKRVERAINILRGVE